MEKKTDTGEFLPGKEGNKVEENKIELDFSQFHLVLFGSTWKFYIIFRKLIQKNKRTGDGIVVLNGFLPFAMWLCNSSH